MLWSENIEGKLDGKYTQIFNLGPHFLTDHPLIDMAPGLFSGIVLI